MLRLSVVMYRMRYISPRRPRPPRVTYQHTAPRPSQPRHTSEGCSHACAREERAAFAPHPHQA